MSTISTVSLDLADPVLTVVDFLKDNWETAKQTVISGYHRGGVDKIIPPIRPVEGEVIDGRHKPRKGQTDLSKTPGGTEILVYEVSETEELIDLRHEFSDVVVRVSIDIYTVKGRDTLRKLKNEVRRITMKVKTSPGGNYTEVDRVGSTPLTNRKAGIWRYVIDVELKKLSDYVGHA